VGSSGERSTGGLRVRWWLIAVDIEGGEFLVGVFHGVLLLFGVFIHVILYDQELLPAFNICQLELRIPLPVHSRSQK
jgi:hypothetical protein